MSLIDKTYFFGELIIPNGNVAGGPVAEELDFFISKYEPQFLRYVLGFELYTAFIAGLLVTPTVPQKWTDLLSGVDYTDQGNRGYRWKGLVQADIKQSPIAMYVYYWFMKNRFTQTAVMGEVATANENAVVANPGAKMASAWNEMSEWLKDLVYFMNNKRDVYPEWTSQRMYAMLNYFTPINEFGI